MVTAATGGGTTDSSSASSAPLNPNQLHQKQQPAFNLVKLFMKQKNSSSSEITSMDVSSGCWPSSEGSSSLEQRIRKKSMNDSGKGSALSRHEEEGMDSTDSHYQVNSFDVKCNTNAKEKSLLSKMAATEMKESDEQCCDVFDEPDGCSSNALYLSSSVSPAQQRRRNLQNPQVLNLTKHNNNNNNNSMQDCKSQFSDASRTSENITQVFCGSSSSGSLSGGKVNNRHLPRDNSNRIKISSSDVITRSMQTSTGTLSSRCSNDRFKFVPPSFLAKLNKLGEERQAPIYVIYPSYALPDLGFVKTNRADVIFSPFNYKSMINSGNLGSASGVGSVKKRLLFDSNNEDEILKNIDYKHVVDWKSLATLLPAEYRKRLKHIPEVNIDLDSDISVRPLFCMSPPIRRNNRTNVCDCAQYFQTRNVSDNNVGVGVGTTTQMGSSSSGSSQPPSSGYRGSSTLLTDSEFELAAAGTSVPQTLPSNDDPLKNMYVYQYENNRMDSGVDMMINTENSARPPRGILRKNAITGKSNHIQRTTNRNSMFEEQNSKVSKFEKRRSLQDPPYYAIGSSDELFHYPLPEDCLAEMEEYYDEMHSNLKLIKNDLRMRDEGTNHNNNQRLSRKDRDARARAENFLSAVPRSELKYYAEIANLLESTEDQTIAVEYDAAKLKKEVSRALSQQKKVSFNRTLNNDECDAIQQNALHTPSPSHHRFSTPPNSPNISTAGLRVHGCNTSGEKSSRHSALSSHRRCSKDKKELNNPQVLNKISSNRFKRLQIQWELLSKDSSLMLKDLASENETKSGGSTPTSANATHRSRIPRPVSYPAGK